MCNTGVLFIIQTLFTRQHDKCCVTHASLIELNIILFHQLVKNSLTGAGFIQRQTPACIYTSFKVFRKFIFHFYQLLWIIIWRFWKNFASSSTISLVELLLHLHVTANLNSKSGMWGRMEITVFQVLKNARPYDHALKWFSEKLTMDVKFYLCETAWFVNEYTHTFHMVLIIILIVILIAFWKMEGSGQAIKISYQKIHINTHLLIVVN